MGVAATVTRAPSSTTDTLDVEWLTADDDGLEEAGGESCRWLTRDSTLPAVGDEAVLLIDSRGDPFALVWPAAVGDTSKVAFPFAAGWADFGGFSEGASVSKQGRSVTLQGGVTKTSGAPVQGDVIGTLAAAYAPTGTLWFPVVSGGAVTTFGVIRVDSSGDVIWWAGSAAETDFTSLGGITYEAAT